MVGVTLYEPNASQKGGFAKSVKRDTEQTAKRLLAIGLVLIVMSITIDQAPEFGGPFTLLVLIAFLTMKTPVIKSYFNQTQGSAK